MFSLPSALRIPAQSSSPRLKLLPLLLIVSMAAPFVPAAQAATTPSLGAAATYGVLASTFTNTSAGTTINGDVGFTTGPAVTPAGAHAHYGSGAPYALAGTDQGIALSSLASQPCTFTFPSGAINLSTDTTHGLLGVYVPGVYCSTGAMNVGGPLILSGNGTYIFRSGGALTSTAGAIVTLIGASACSVFWTPTQATTLAANTTFAGIVMDDAGITVGANTTWTGMALAFGGTVTTDTNFLTICAAASSSSSSSSSSVTSSSAASSSSVPTSSASSSHSNSSVQASSARSSSVRSSSAASSRASSVRSRPVYVPPPAPAPTPVPLLPNTGVGDAGVETQESFGSSLELLLRNLSSLFLNVYRSSLKSGTVHLR
ncbi:TPA: hypothetical protein DCL30_04685 [Candidatus Peribacteria bacterium]|nr:MAG: hypothetical protein A2529_04745 [Candidatus Peribacteria bacterium RIFOXYD2_FULL_58_15]HAI98799.1 hypothetical protein [Candidatus Peribacteria bacterium]HAS34079.1 hypothetical protein [Candidatus Peribacteria bacterium]